jgi:hypothetical protein
VAAIINGAIEKYRKVAQLKHIWSTVYAFGKQCNKIQISTEKHQADKKVMSSTN